MTSRAAANGFPNHVNAAPIYVMSQVPDLAGAIRAQLGPDFRVVPVPIRSHRGKFELKIQIGPEELSDLAEAEVLVTDNNLVPQVLYRAPKLRWVQGTWAGVELIVKAVKAHISGPPPFPVTRFSGAGFGQILAEYVLAQIINRERRFYHVAERSRQKRWKENDCISVGHFRPISETTVLVLGAFGALGSHVARVLHCLGARVVGYGRKERTQEELGPGNVEAYSADLGHVLPLADYIVNVLPSTPATVGLLGNQRLKICADRKPVLVNVGRGTLLTEADVLVALDRKWIGGAILDVFQVEPLPQSSKLWTHPDVTITPHIAVTLRPSDVAKVFKDNLARFLRGAKLKFEIDWEQEY